MNVLQFLAAQPWVERLGSTLLHFLWQGVLIAAVYALARRCASRPNARYMLACAALVLMAAAPVLTWILLRAPVTNSSALPVAPSIAAAAPHAVRTTPAVLPDAVTRVVAAPILPWVVAVWFAGAVALWLRLMVQWLLAERLRSRLVRPAPREWQEALDRLKGRIRVSRPVRLLVSTLVPAPAVVGWIRPVVLVPVGVLTGLPPDQVEALLLHELAHIRRHDYCVHVLQSAIEALLFYHPAVWWISGHIRAERELCCDDAVVLVSGDAICYARALAELTVASQPHPRAVMAANGGSLAHRIGRLLGHSRPAPHMRSGPGTLALFLGAAALAVIAQPAARPKFEVASVKPSEERGLTTVRPSPGGLFAEAPVRRLMQYAFNLPLHQIEGGPEWIDSSRYEIDAKAGHTITRAQAYVMLQSLLEDRFQLKTHRETRELPVYRLEAVRSGLKLAAPKEGSCQEVASDAPAEWVAGRMQVPTHSAIPQTLCGVASLALHFDGVRLQGGSITTAELARELSLFLGRAVIDKTGFTGRFDLSLDFQPDETTPALPPPPPGSGESKTPPFPAALQQIGLRLEAGKGPVEVTVIDHVERPAVN